MGFFGGSDSDSLAAQVTPTVTAAPAIEFDSSFIPQIAAVLPLLVVAGVAFVGARTLTGKKRK